MSVYVCIGKYAGFKIGGGRRGLRIVLGWISLAILFFDIEQHLANLNKCQKKCCGSCKR